MESIEFLASWLVEARRAIVFTGAGISTESGIPDYRSPNGIWARSRPVYFDDFLASAEARYEYWRQKAASHEEFMRSRPNPGHLAVARWEAEGRVQAVITQNIDGLHTIAGSRDVCELHGTARRIGCLECGTQYDADPLVRRFLADDHVPSCPACGGILKHATISFGQALNEKVLQRATDLARNSDLFLAIGSSLVVQPAAGLPALARRGGARLVIINRDPTPLDDSADAVIHEPIGRTLSEVERRVQQAGRPTQ